MKRLGATRIRQTRMFLNYLFCFSAGLALSTAMASCMKIELLIVTTSYMLFGALVVLVFSLFTFR